MLTEEQFKQALPVAFRGNVTPEVMKGVNELLSDPNVAEQYRDNLVGYTNVIKEGKFKLESYVYAVKYVTQKMMGKNNTDAYIATFPDKYQDFCNRGVSQKDIASYISAYNKGKLVSLIMEQSLIPVWVGNQDLYQKALNVQAELMMNATSEKVRCEAANSILTQLKQPDKTKITLDVSEEASDTMKALRDSTMALVAQQREMIQAGMTNAKDVAGTALIIDGEVL